eukprot:TRINITY_DN3322_c0_g3_i1.p1 TRINITY_DN3322_c0_g3~~TRINITY_DN3322_c0_g3_i1.p1  ORF type:complete len:981 (+),score=200.71 TRINITY_DN3322_c0_g3_i1:22-2964(+)
MSVAQLTQKAFLGALKKPKNEKKVKAAFDLVDQDKDGKHVVGDWLCEVMVATFKAVIEGLINEPKKNNVSATLKSVLASFFSTIDYKDLAETLFNMTDIDKKGYLEYDDFQSFVLHWSARKDEFLISALTIKQLQSEEPKEFVLSETQRAQLEVLEKLHQEGVLTKFQLEKQKVSLGLCPALMKNKSRKDRKLKVMEARPRPGSIITPTRGTIKVQLLGARNLPTHKFGQPNTYAAMSTTWPAPSFTQGERRNSMMCKNTTDPSWNETFSFDIDSSTSAHTLTINLWDSQMFGLLMNLGYVSFHVPEIVKQKLNEPCWYTLKNSLKKESQGELQLAITWEEHIIKRQPVTKLDLQTKILSARAYFSPRSSSLASSTSTVDTQSVRESFAREPSLRDKEGSSGRESTGSEPSVRDSLKETRGKRGRPSSEECIIQARERRRTFAPGAFVPTMPPTKETEKKSSKRNSERAPKWESAGKKNGQAPAGMPLIMSRHASPFLFEQGGDVAEQPLARAPVVTLTSTLSFATKSLQEERQTSRNLMEKLEQMKEEKEELLQKLIAAGLASEASGSTTSRNTDTQEEQWSTEKINGLVKENKKLQAQLKSVKANFKEKERQLKSDMAIMAKFSETELEMMRRERDKERILVEELTLEKEKCMRDNNQLKMLLDKSRGKLSSAANTPREVRKIEIIEVQTQQELFVHLKYTDDDLLGEGAYASVYKALEINSGKTVAVKVINLLDALDEIDSVYKEIDVQRSMNHPNVLSLSTMYELNKENFYLAMPLMSGGNLLEFVNDWEGEFGLPDREAKLIFQQILQGLKYMHDNFIAHCDIKPENILLDSDFQEIKICDFGEARKFTSDDETLTGHCGTPYYQALEIWQRGKYTKAVDLWAAGVILYVTVAKLQPWDYYFESEFDENEDFEPDVDQIREAIIYTVTNDTFPFEDPDFPEENTENIQDMIRKLLTLDPNKRLTAKQALTHQWFN